MATTPVWHGTQREEELLHLALARNCTCEFIESILQKPCAGHLMLADQKAIDKLLYGLRISHRLWREEWGPTSRAL